MKRSDQGLTEDRIIEVDDCFSNSRNKTDSLARRRSCTSLRLESASEQPAGHVSPPGVFTQHWTDCQGSRLVLRYPSVMDIVKMLSDLGSAL